VIPSDQISAEKSCPVYSITSGAIQQGDPTKVFLFWPFFNEADTPKSLMKTLPSISRRMLPAFMSLWIYLFSWKYCSPFKVSFKIVAMIASSLTPYGKFSFNMSLHEPALSKGITSQRSVPSMNETWQLTTFLC